MSEIDVVDGKPWYLPNSSKGRYLEVWCGNAYLLVCKENGHTTIGYQDEQTYLPTAYDAEDIADWLKILQWRAEWTPTP